MDKSTILASLLLLPILAASGCREKCSSSELRYGDKCILRPDSGTSPDEDASQEESVETIEGDDSAPDNDASTDESIEDTDNGVEASSDAGPDRSDMDASAPVLDAQPPGEYGTCTPASCRNGGTCSRPGGSCTCPSGFGGSSCETDVCASNPCKNGGTCSRTGMLCTCATGYTGTSCTQCTAGYVSNGAGGCVFQPQLTLLFSGDGFGDAVLSDALGSCNGNCSFTLRNGQKLTLSGQPQPYSKVTFTGPGCTSSSCNLTMSADVTINVRVELAHNVAFTTQAEFVPGADFSGASQADERCRVEASAAGLHGQTWRAWLSTGSQRASARLAGARGWVRPDGFPIADRVEDLIANGPIYTLAIGADRMAYPGVVFTGTNGDGSPGTDFCGDWTTSSGRALSGNSERVGTTWTNVANTQCSEQYHLYCFGIDSNVALPAPARASGKLVFVSTTTFTPQPAGLMIADVLCQTDACNRGLTGSSNCSANLGSARVFKALLGVSVGSPFGRFNSSGPWVTLGGLVWMTARATLPLTGVESDDDPSPIYTGISPTQFTETAAEYSCNDWTNPAPEGRVSAGIVSSGGRGAFAGATAICSYAYRVYCLED